MNLSRDELAARVLVGGLSGGCTGSPASIAADAVAIADALLSALAVPPSVAAPVPAAPARPESVDGAATPLNTYNLNAVRAAFPSGCEVRVVKAAADACGLEHPVGAVRTVIGYEEWDGVWRLLVKNGKGWVLYCGDVERVDDDASHPATTYAAPAPYVPKVGDKVRYINHEAGVNDRIVTAVNGRGRFEMRSICDDGGVSSGDTTISWWVYLGPATAAERAAAGLSVDEAPAETPSAAQDAGLPEDAAPDAPPVPPAATAPDFTEDDIDALAAKMHFGWYTTRGLTVVPWGDVSFDGRKSWRDAAEAALAWFRSRGAKS